jgi:DNA-directed RNA polymerase subunit M/transcription elongation factor TFIIS
MGLQDFVKRLRNEIMSVASQLPEEGREELAEELRKIAVELKTAPAPRKCPRCGELMELVEVRPGRRPGLKEVRIWRCRKCSLELEEKVIDIELIPAYRQPIYVF